MVETIQVKCAETLFFVGDTKGPGWKELKNHHQALEFFKSSVMSEEDNTSVDNLSIYERTLPFYNNISLIIFKKFAHDTFESYMALRHDQDKFFLIYNTDDISEFNANHTFTLNEQNVLAYLKFFCFFMTDKDNEYDLLYILENPLCEFIYILADLIKERVFYGFQQPTIQFTEENQKYLIKKYDVFTRMIYNNKIYDAQFSVGETGSVKLIEKKYIGDY